MKYIIMCGGTYTQWESPRQLTVYKGEMIVERTIRQLRENGVEDIAISTNDPAFDRFGIPILSHLNSFRASGYNKQTGYWVDAFYPTDEPCCYIFGDVVFSDAAIRTIVEKETEDIEFFASAPPFGSNYPKPWAEPFAFKVQDQKHFQESIKHTKKLDKLGMFRRHPLAWELWQVIKGTALNRIDYTNYVAINDGTCDIDAPEDVEVIKV